MLKTLFTISERFRGKKCFIYGINRNAVCVFTDLAYRRIDVQGFLDPQYRCVGQYFMNRPILSLKSIDEDKDSYIVISRYYTKVDVQRTLQNEEIYYINEILDIDTSLKSKRVILYGLGERGKEIYSLLKKKEIEISDVCETVKSRVSWMGKKVYSIEEIEISSNTAILIAVKAQNSKVEMVKNIKICKGDIYVDEIIDLVSVYCSNTFWVINKSINEQKEIYLFENYSEECKLMEDVLTRYQVSVVGKVYKGETRDVQLMNIFDLAYRDIDKITVIISEYDEKLSESVCDILEGIGFSLEKHNYTSMHLETRKYRSGMQMMNDCLTGHAMRGNGNLPGYVVYGKKQRNGLKILVLGGSTSTVNYYRVRSWVNQFYDRLTQKGIEVTLYNSASCGYDIVQELMWLLRDGFILKPDYVISMSGVNNISRKEGTNNQFCVKDYLNRLKVVASQSEYVSGVSDECESLYDFWYRNTKVMKMVCSLWGGKFYSFLQPINIGVENAGLNEISMYEQDDCLENARIFRERAKAEENPLYTNLIDLFDLKEDMYIDNCHYSKQANSILADIVYNKLFSEADNI